MCLIINREEGQDISDDFFKDVAVRNKDGWGIMYVDPRTGKVSVNKGMTMDAFLGAYHKLQEKDIPCVIHFRMKTHGSVSVDNCHPFEVTRGVYLMHNGVVDVAFSKKDKDVLSDTAVFAKDILRPMVLSMKDRVASLRSTWFTHFMDAQADSHNSRFVIMDLEGPLFFGNWTKTTKGVWCSNTYAYTMDNPVKPAYTPYSPSRSITPRSMESGYWDHGYGDDYAFPDDPPKSSVNTTGGTTRAQDAANKANTVYVTNYSKQTGETTAEYYIRNRFSKDWPKYKCAGETDFEFNERMRGAYTFRCKLPVNLDKAVLQELVAKSPTTRTMYSVERNILTSEHYAEMYIKEAEKLGSKSATPFQSPTQGTNPPGTQPSQANSTSTTPPVVSQESNGKSSQNVSSSESNENETQEKSLENNEENQKSDYSSAEKEVSAFIDLVNQMQESGDRSLVDALEDELEETLDNFNSVAEEDWILPSDIIEDITNRIVTGEFNFVYDPNGNSYLLNENNEIIYPDHLSTVKTTA